MRGAGTPTREISPEQLSNSKFELASRNWLAGTHGLKVLADFSFS
jgi:hypothetical protein